MGDITLVAETGRIHGSGISRRLRHDGRIPAVVYGHGVDTTSITVDGRALRSALTTEAGTNAVIELDVDGTQHLAMAKEIQRHPVRGTVAHVDFLVVNRNEIVTVEVPIVLIGEALEVRNAGGSVDHELFTLTVHCTPGQIPPSIEVDVSELTIGSAVRVSDIVLPAGVTTDVDPEAPIAIAHAAAGEEEAPATEEAEGEPGEAAAAGAEAPADGPAEG
jgi:large subunit ribosomal protein L25